VLRVQEVRTQNRKKKDALPQPISGRQSPRNTGRGVSDNWSRGGSTPNPPHNFSNAVLLPIELRTVTPKTTHDSSIRNIPTHNRLFPALTDRLLGVHLARCDEKSSPRNWLDLPTAPRSSNSLSRVRIPRAFRRDCVGSLSSTAKGKKGPLSSVGQTVGWFCARGEKRSVLRKIHMCRIQTPHSI